MIDFGVARAAERMGRTTARGAVGTPAYMAPEQARDTRQASVASDVYSLGATLLFAATGHPPYQGASVMDVLARLATEEPDLSGVPGELSELITACMHRVPRQRPTSTAMLVQLGDFTVGQAGPDEEHSYLPDKVMALIAEYQRSPQIGPLGEFADERGDATSASYTELPASYRPAPRRKPGHGRTGPGPGTGPAGAAPAGGGGCGRTWPGPAGPPSARPWSWWASSSVPRSAVPARRARRPARGCPPAVGAEDRMRLTGPGRRRSGACMVRQSLGPADAAWVVRASGFEPGKPVTVALTLTARRRSGRPQKFTRTVHVTPFRRDLPAEHQSALPRRAPARLFDVQVTGPGGREATTRFIVIPPGAP